MPTRIDLWHGGYLLHFDPKEQRRIQHWLGRRDLAYAFIQACSRNTCPKRDRYRLEEPLSREHQTELRRYLKKYNTPIMLLHGGRYIRVKLSPSKEDA